MIKQSYGKDMILCEDAEFCKEDKIGVSIIYAYEDSDVCYPAKLLKHGINCLCFASKEPIAKGGKIYIFTQDFPIDGAQLRIYEGSFIQIEECKKTDNFKNNPSFLIRGKSVSSKMMSIASNELGVEVLKSEISYL
jgi:hypothetical protein